MGMRLVYTYRCRDGERSYGIEPIRSFDGNGDAYDQNRSSPLLAKSRQYAGYKDVYIDDYQTPCERRISLWAVE